MHTMIGLHCSASSGRQWDAYSQLLPVGMRLVAPYLDDPTFDRLFAHAEALTDPAARREAMNIPKTPIVRRYATLTSWKAPAVPVVSDRTSSIPW